jgi:hypothetical protein
MITKKNFEDVSVHVKLKLAALWASFMFLYVYVDYFSLYMPNKIDDITKGKVFIFDITQAFIFITLALASVPILMVFLSVTLPAKINRLTNIIVAIIHIPYMLFNLAGEAWIHMIFAAVIEVILLCFIIYYACKWPSCENSSTSEKIENK